ncbi:MAG: insulinase family protein, partial [Bacteroidales bacterium]|nr:insulinase family protein [Bacteroidales bacterium]
LYLEYVEPRFDNEEWDNAISQLKAVIPNALNTPAFKLQKGLNEFIYGGDPRAEFISMDILEKANLETVEKNYRKLFADAAGAVLVITGDVVPENIKPLVEKYVGSLPKGKKASSWKDVSPKFVKGEAVKVLQTDMETPKTTVFQLYSDYRPYSVKDKVLCNAVSYVLDQIYVETLREDEGGTYGASSAAEASKEPEERYILQVAFECKPERADNLKTLAREEFRKLAENGPTDEQFTRTLENFKKNVPEQRINNNYWMQTILNHYRFGGDYDAEYEAAVNSMTKEEIRDAAAKLYSSGNFLEFVQVPGKTSE